MNVLVDAHLPRKAAAWFRNAGCDAIHTLEMPNANRTTDAEIRQRAELEQRVVVSKDADFVNSHILIGEPSRLLLVSTGNITNRELEQLLVPLMPTIIAEFQTHSFLELSRSGIVVRG